MWFSDKTLQCPQIWGAIFYTAIIVFFSFFFFLWPHHTACGILVPDQGLNLSPQQWKCCVLTTRPPRNSLYFNYKRNVPFQKILIFLLLWSHTVLFMFFFHFKVFSNLGLYQASKLLSDTWETKAYMEKPKVRSQQLKSVGFLTFSRSLKTTFSSEMIFKKHSR